jgi:sensor domain CHASE-containing protein
LIAAVLFTASVLMLRVQREDIASGQRAVLRQAVSAAAALVQADLAQTLQVANTLEFLLRISGNTDDFDRLAQELMLSHPLISSIALAPGGVIRQVAPLDGQGSLIGRGMYEDPAASAELAEAVRKRTMVISEPQLLMSGGVGSMARMPVFRASAATGVTPALWGFVLVQFRVPNIAARLTDAGLERTEGRFMLSVMDGKTGQRIRFYPFPVPAMSADVETASITLPQRQWQLAVEAPAPVSSTNLATLAVAGLASAAAGLASALLLRQRRRRLALRSFQRQSVPRIVGHDELDAAHHALDQLRRMSGWTVMLLLRLPDGPRRADAGEPAALVRAMLRGNDQLVALGGDSFLLIAHSLPDRAVAERVCDRLAVQARGLGPEGRVQVQRRQFDLPQADVRLLFAEMVADMHLDVAALRRSGIPERADMPRSRLPSQG